MEIDLQQAATKVALGVCTALIVALGGFLWRRLRKLDGMGLAQARCLVLLRATHEISLVMAPPEKADAIRDIVREMNRELERLAGGNTD